jgi:hypothetical protein
VQVNSCGFTVVATATTALSHIATVGLCVRSHSRTRTRTRTRTRSGSGSGSFGAVARCLAEERTTHITTTRTGAAVWTEGGVRVLGNTATSSVSTTGAVTDAAAADIGSDTSWGNNDFNLPMIVSVCGPLHVFYDLFEQLLANLHYN